MKFRDIMIGVVLGAVLVGFLNFVDHEMKRPIAQKSTATDRIVSVQLNDGTVLKPGEPGFKEAVEKSNSIDWVP